MALPTHIDPAEFSDFGGAIEAELGALFRDDPSVFWTLDALQRQIPPPPAFTVQGYASTLRYWRALAELERSGEIVHIDTGSVWASLAPDLGKPKRGKRLDKNSRNYSRRIAPARRSARMAALVAPRSGGCT
jgi:hypothetical protein